MYSLIVFLSINLMFLVPAYGLVNQFPSLPIPSDRRCEQPVTGGKNVIVGLYPLQVIVTKIDHEKATIDFITEVGTSLHVTQASPYDLAQLQLGDTVELCIVEELHGEAKI